MRKKFFNSHLFKEGFKQLKLFGIISLIIYMLSVILIFINEVDGRRIVDIYDCNPLVLLSFTVLAPLFTLFLFSFITSRNSSDFYHSIPYTRTCIFVSFFASIAAWIALIHFSSTVVSVYTEDLTQEMFSALQGGYSVEFMKYTAYDGEVGTAEFFESSVDEKNYAFKRYIGNKTEDGITKGKIMETSHYQPNPEEDEEWLYNAGLSIGNTVIYTPVMGRDKYTFQEIELTWDEGGYSNAFALLSLGDFTRVDDENKWALNVNSSSFKSSSKS